MSLFINQDASRTKLQEKIAADLQTKSKQKADIASPKPDEIEDSAYMQDSKKTTSVSLVWLLIFLVIIGLIIVWLFLAI